MRNIYMTMTINNNHRLKFISRIETIFNWAKIQSKNIEDKVQ